MKGFLTFIHQYGMNLIIKLTPKERKQRNRKMQIITPMCLWPILQKLDLGQFGLCQGLDNVTKHLRTLFESKKLKSNQIRIQIELT